MSKMGEGEFMPCPSCGNDVEATVHWAAWEEEQKKPQETRARRMPVPCPHCGTIIRNVVPLIRLHKYGWFWALDSDKTWR